LRDFRRNAFLSLVILAILLRPFPSSAQYESIVSRVDPAVVFIFVTKPRIGNFSGTGFFITPNGYILTARHLLEGADTVTVRTATGQQLSAVIVSYSTEADAAVVKVDGTSFPILHLGNSDVVRQGQEVLAFGYPLSSSIGVESVTVTRGIVSALRPQEGLSNSMQRRIPVIAVVQSSQ
jgi:S1-C subfamily serine protease